MTESRGQPRIVTWGPIVVGNMKESILFYVDRFRFIDVRAFSRILAPRESHDFDVGFSHDTNSAFTQPLDGTCGTENRYVAQQTVSCSLHSSVPLRCFIIKETKKLPFLPPFPADRRKRAEEEEEEHESSPI